MIVALLALIVFIVLATTYLKLHPFLALLSAAFIAAFVYQIPLVDITGIVTNGFGSILGYIGIVIVVGTIIGIILERSGAAITMAEAVISVLGERFPTLTMTIIGYFVSIPVFCDSGYVILNSLKDALSARMKASKVAMSIALASGLYATHTFVPPTPGPIAAAGNLGLESSLGLIIAVGLCVALVVALSGMFWGNRFSKIPDNLLLENSSDDLSNEEIDFDELKRRYGELPTRFQAFSPIVFPIMLICFSSIFSILDKSLFPTSVASLVQFLGQPVVALFVGLFFACRLLKGDTKRQQFYEYVTEGLKSAAPILLITGAGGAFGAVLKETSLATELGQNLSGLNVGIFMPFLVAAALKTAQGSSTVALVTTSAMVAPLMASLGLDSEAGRVLAVLAIGAGAMTVSHANDSFFWIVTQFSHMKVSTAYKAQTMATLVQGITGITVVWLISLFWL